MSNEDLYEIIKNKKTSVNLLINVLMSPFYATFTISLQLWLNEDV